jgi:sterol desaturase/sphingolipid hydroxylase (fatty acid hydroxylase superfamily)
MSIIQASIPLFFLLIIVELVYARLRGQSFVRLNDSIADLSLGVLSQLTGVFLKLLTIGIYIVVETRWSVQHWLPVPAWPEGAPLGVGGAAWVTVHWPELASWTIAFLLVDLAYYWSHRLSHVVHILWAGHVVHHSSEEYNLTVALRQSSLHGLFTWVFYIPLAVAGVPWRMYVACYALNLVYQFWIHTRAIGRMGRVAELVLNTPSHHRVHHGVNPRYQDRNYAGVFIIWDRWFGTFEPEDEEPVYGITTPLASWNPIWANVHVFVAIARDAWRTQRWRDKLRVVFGHPGWRPADLGTPYVAKPVSPATFLKFDPEIPRAVAAYALAQFIVVLLASVQLLAASATLPIHQTAAAGFYVAISLTNIGGVFERSRWAYTLELARLTTLLVICAGLAVLSAISAVLLGAIAAFAVASLAWLWTLRRHLTVSFATYGPGGMAAAGHGD